MAKNTQAIFLTEEDQALLRRLIASERLKSVNTIKPYEPDIRTRVRGMYVALPDTEITALEEYGTGSSGTGTGSGETGDPDRPGSGLCRLYRLVENGLYPLSERTQRVYNSSRVAIDRDWIQVHQDSAGVWWALPSGGGTANIIRFRIVSADNCGTCTAVAEVISVMSGGTTVPEEDQYGQVTIIDRVGCVLNEPAITALVGRKGYAAYMTSREEGPCPGLPTTGWEIISMCPEESMCA